MKNNKNKSNKTTKSPTCAGGKGCGKCQDKFNDKKSEDSFVEAVENGQYQAVPDYASMDDVTLERHVNALLECVYIDVNMVIKNIEVVRR
jgi:hypothetical protein